MHDVLVTKADKGQATVIISKSRYVCHMNDMLNDVTTYKKLISDPVKRLIKRFNDLVKSWRDNGLIDYAQYFKLFCSTFNF